MAGEKCILDPERECLGLMEARRLEKELERYKTETDDRLTKQGERIGELEKSTAVIESNYAHILAKLDDLISKVVSIEKKPAQRWEMVVEKIVLLLVAAAVGYFLSRVGISI